MPDASILIVEDETIVAEDLAKKLQRLGYAVAGTTDLGEDAFKLTQELRPSLVLMDIRLAGAMDGVEAAERIRRECGVPVIYLTASSDRATVDRAKVTEPFGYILKPFEDRELGSQIEMALYKHQAERKLRESEERFRLAAVAAHAMVYDMDVRTKRVNAMHGLRSLLGYEEGKAELSFDWWDRRIHSDDLPRCRAAFEKMRAAPREHAIEYRVTHKDGRTLFVEDQAAPVCDKSGRVVRIVGTVVDITGRKTAQEALRRTAEELARSNKELEQFAYVASHDLQEPLHMVNGFLSLLEAKYKPQLDAKAGEYIGYAVEGATRMSQLISDLLEYSRAGRSMNFKPVDAGRVLDAALSNLGGAIREAEAVITRDGIPVVNGDATQLTQLLQNLVGNAVKFRSKDRPCQVHVGVKKVIGHQSLGKEASPSSNGQCPMTNDAWLFSVRDNGIGIAPEHADRIFTIFQRLHTREQYPGTGIGLAICKKIVEGHGGRIWVESDAGHGASFLFTLPEVVER